MESQPEFGPAPAKSYPAIERVLRSHRRSGWAVVVLVLAGGVWLIALDSDDADATTVTGVVILEVVTVVLVVWAAWRYLRLGNLIGAMAAREEQERQFVMTSTVRMDEGLARLGDGSREALAVAEQTVPAWRLLIIQRYDLRRLLMAERRAPARDAAAGQLDEWQAAIEALEHALARVVASPEPGAAELAPLREAGAHAASLSARYDTSPLSA